MEYTFIGLIVVSSITIVSFLKPILKISNLLAKLELTLESMIKIVDDNNLNNRKEHDELYEGIKELSEIVHELREKLIKLETEHKMNQLK